MNIGIIGRARAGKDTAGQWLTDNRGYRRIGFADPLKEAALKVDPIVDHLALTYGYETPVVRLSEVVRDLGWEKAKDAHPEVRRFLQELGAAIRALDEDFWLRTAMAKVQEANENGVPAVITDVRYPNEASRLRREGFHLIYIERPGVEQLNHESEGALTSEDATYRIDNTGDVYDLQQEVSIVADHVYNIESRRHYARSLS